MCPVVIHGRGIRRDEESPSEGPELIVNGTFDSNLDSWVNWGMDNWTWTDVGGLGGGQAVAGTTGDPT